MKLGVSLLKMSIKTMPSLNQQLNHLKTIFLQSVAAVKPKQLIRDCVKMENDRLIVSNDVYTVKKQCYVVGFGKAVFDMAHEIEGILGESLKMGIVNVPVGISSVVASHGGSSKITFIEGACDNLPDENAQKGAQMIKSLIEKLEVDDLLLVLISGGGSALLPLPKHPLTMMEKLNITKNLAKRGATIQELNCVRKHLSELKGGGLAKLAYPAQVVSLILSDIIDDPLEYIASGPTVSNSDSVSSAINIIKKYSLYDELPRSIKTLLVDSSDAAAATAETFNHVRNYIIGNNEIATKAASSQATAFGYQTFVLSTRVSGEVDRISKIYAELARKLASLINSKFDRDNFKLFLETLKGDLKISESVINNVINFNFDVSRGICLICGGEPTVIVKGNGKGGRNQELALSFSIEINKLKVESANVSFLSCGTDGIDGPTDAAGAFGTSNLVNNAFQKLINPTEFLADNDSYGFYTKYNNGEFLIRTGHTGTNVMDIHILIVSPKV